MWTALDAANGVAGGGAGAPLPAADIAERARLQGLSSEGGPVETLKRLAWLQEYTQQRGRGSGAGSGGLPSSLPAVASSAAGSILAALLGQAPEPTAAPASEATGPVGTGAMSESAPADPEGAAAPVTTRGVKRRRRAAPKGGPASSAWAAVDLEEEERQRKARRLESMERADESGAPSESDEDLDGVPLVAPMPAATRDIEAGILLPLVAMPPVCEAVAAGATPPGPPQLALASYVHPQAASEGKGSGSDSDDIDGVPL